MYICTLIYVYMIYMYIYSIPIRRRLSGGAASLARLRAGCRLHARRWGLNAKKYVIIVVSRLWSFSQRQKWSISAFVGPASDDTRARNVSETL